MHPSIFHAGIAFISLGLSSSAIASNVPATETAAVSASPSVEFAKFKPQPKSELKIDYTFLDDILNNLVFLTGVSTRQIASKPEAIVGSRFVWEHTSPLRQEGNKIPFSKLNQSHIATLQEYKRELEDLSLSVNIASLSKNEQLAYWINLHNVTVIMLIAENYPVLQPSKLRVGPQKDMMHDAKVISVNGSKISLRDIRENIVFPNWKDAKVIYGFFQGDIGSPSLQGQAFNAGNTEALLQQNANEFVNSLRSFSRGRVSKIYKDAERFYFPNFEKDLREHFQLYMWDEVYEELSKASNLSINSYDYDIADMEGGRGSGVIGNVTIDGKPVTDSQSYAIASYTNQIKDKTKILLRQGKIKRAVVTVGDEDETGESKAEPVKAEEAKNN
jgi:Protein of unknown function, DUF547